MSVLASESTTAAGRRPTGSPLLEVRDLTRRFGPVVAVDGLSLELGSGEILGVLGENGAGKSTLLNMLAGMIQPDTGEIVIDGRSFTALTPGLAIRHGIGTVYQHFSLVSSLSVRENLLLGSSPGRNGGSNRLRQALELLDLPLSPDTPVRALSMGERQRLEIAKVLARGTRVLLLDEPTSVLTPQEVERLFAVLSQLRDAGVGVVLVTHKLGEALGLCDRIVVMRTGRLQGEVERSEIQGVGGGRDRIVEMMFGRDKVPEVAASAPASLPTGNGATAPLLRLDRVRINDDRGHAVIPAFSLEVFPGELFGIAGVDGNGQRELAEAIAGQRPIAAGSIRLAGQDLSASGVQGAGRWGSVM